MCSAARSYLSLLTKKGGCQVRHAGSSLQRGPAVFAHLASVPPCEEREIRPGSTCSSPQKNLETELTGARGASEPDGGPCAGAPSMAPGHRDLFPAKPDISTSFPPSLSARAYLNSLAESAGWRGGCCEGLAGRVLAWPWGAGSRRAPGVTGARGSGHNAALYTVAASHGGAS